MNLLASILYFPCWWYSRGLQKRAQEFTNGVCRLSRYLALKILLQNLFKPMFGQYDRTGRIISFFMRCFQLLIRLFIFLLGTVFLFALLILWIILPIVAIWQIITLI